MAFMFSTNMLTLSA